MEKNDNNDNNENPEFTKKKELIRPYKFCIINPVVLDSFFPEDGEANHYMPDDVFFKERQHYIAYLRKTTRIALHNELSALARAADMDQEECEMLTDGEYVEYESEDEFICFDGYKEEDAQLYLETNNYHFEYAGSGMTEDEYWDDDDYDAKDLTP